MEEADISVVSNALKVVESPEDFVEGMRGDGFASWTDNAMLELLLKTQIKLLCGILQRLSDGK